MDEVLCWVPLLKERLANLEFVDKIYYIQELKNDVEPQMWLDGPSHAMHLEPAAESPFKHTRSTPGVAFCIPSQAVSAYAHPYKITMSFENFHSKVAPPRV